MLEVIVLGGVVWIVFRGIILVRSQNKNDISIRRELLSIAFTIYCIAVIRVTIFPLYLNLGAGPRFSPSINIIPFFDILRGFEQSHFSFAFKLKLLLRNLLGNFLLLLPLGFFLPMFWVKLRSFKRTLAIGALISVSIETAQYLLVYLGLSVGRASDIDDLILNTVGVIFGYLIFESISFGLSYIHKFRGLNKQI